MTVICPKCNTSNDRGAVNGLDDYSCLKCGHEWQWRPGSVADAQPPLTLDSSFDLAERRQLRGLIACVSPEGIEQLRSRVDKLEHASRAPRTVLFPLVDDYADLPTSCTRCGLPFDRSGQTKVYPKKLLETLARTNPNEKHANTRCPRFVGRLEIWTCEGERVSFGTDQRREVLHDVNQPPKCGRCHSSHVARTQAGGMACEQCGHSWGEPSRADVETASERINRTAFGFANGTERGSVLADKLDRLWFTIPIGPKNTRPTDKMIADWDADTERQLIELFDDPTYVARPGAHPSPLQRMLKLEHGRGDTDGAARMTATFAAAFELPVEGAFAKIKAWRKLVIEQLTARANMVADLESEAVKLRKHNGELLSEVAGLHKAMAERLPARLMKLEIDHGKPYDPNAIGTVTSFVLRGEFGIAQAEDVRHFGAVTADPYTSGIIAAAGEMLSALTPGALAKLWDATKKLLNDGELADAWRFDIDPTMIAVRPPENGCPSNVCAIRKTCTSATPNLCRSTRTLIEHEPHGDVDHAVRLAEAFLRGGESEPFGGATMTTKIAHALVKIAGERGSVAAEWRKAAGLGNLGTPEMLAAQLADGVQTVATSTRDAKDLPFRAGAAAGILATVLDYLRQMKPQPGIMSVSAISPGWIEGVSGDVERALGQLVTDDDRIWPPKSEIVEASARLKVLENIIAAGRTKGRLPTREQLDEYERLLDITRPISAREASRSPGMPKLEVRRVFPSCSICKLEYDRHNPDYRGQNMCAYGGRPEKHLAFSLRALVAEYVLTPGTKELRPGMEHAAALLDGALPLALHPKGQRCKEPCGDILCSGTTFCTKLRHPKE